MTDRAPVGAPGGTEDPQLVRPEPPDWEFNEPTGDPPPSGPPIMAPPGAGSGHWPVGGAPVMPPGYNPFGPGQLGIGQIPGNWELYQMGDKYYLVYQVPTGADSDTIPIAYEADVLDITQYFGWNVLELEENVVRELSVAEFQSAGGLVVGFFEEIDLTTSFWEDPFEHWLTQLNEAAILAPWLLDPEIMALAAAAYLEGRSLTQAELAATDWWQNHNVAEREWLVLASSDPAEADKIMEANQLVVEDMLTQAGISNADTLMFRDENGNEVSLAQWLARVYTTGSWSQIQLDTQIKLLADPLLDGDRDETLMGLLAGHEDFLDVTQSDEDRVRDLFLKWLGPLYGAVSDQVVAEWASQFRNDPDTQIRLEEMLAGQRVALFPAYDDRTLTYEDIAGPWKGLFMSTWGEVPDETDPFFTNIVNLNDATKAAQALRSEGLVRGNGQVLEDAVTDLSSAFGGGVVPTR